ncbi:MAG: DUF1553 domain-containing protein [Planctomycetota bacterium]|nr:DUF1553 domain-containing protein [Planctomycetota bacterium]
MPFSSDTLPEAGRFVRLDGPYFRFSPQNESDQTIAAVFRFGFRTTMMLKKLFPLFVSVATFAAFSAKSLSAPIVPEPATITLVGPHAQQQLIVGETVDGLDLDLTRKVEFVSENTTVATVDVKGLVSPVSNGKAVILIRRDTDEARVTVEVRDGQKQQAVDFQNDIIPILTAGGCNSGPCHGKARGQNGFQLSLLGFDANFDYESLAKEARGRRVFLPSPEESLLLLKPSGRVPHGGGIRLAADGPEYETLLRWINAGMPRQVEKAPELTGISVTPTERIMGSEAEQQLIVTAHYSDGSTRDVTRQSHYQSNEGGIAGVDDEGLVSTTGVTGEAAITTRYMGMFAVAAVSVPLSDKVPPDVYEKLPRNNFIDELVWKKLQRLNLTPSEPAPDHDFLRRAYVDIIGRVPTAEETRTFLADQTPDRRQKLIDGLLDDPEYADHWANKWADLLRPNPYHAGIKAVLNYDNWIRDSFRRNKPYDQFVRELLTAKGGTFRNGAVTMFRDRRTPDELTTIVSQLFLGIRMECAKCHHHPNEVWGQADFYGLAAYFDRIGRKGTGISAPISGSEEFFFAGKRVAVKHPLTGEVVTAKPLFGEATVADDLEDPREVLADWVTSDDNPFFRQVMSNRVWFDMMGRGLVEPVDDLRATNPPSNPALLEALAIDLRDHGYDLKHLIRTIASSYVYSLSSVPNERNAVDTRNYSRFYRDRLRAEVLLDSVSQITGVQETYAAMPPGSTARQLWSHRIDSLFLDAFGRPDPNQNPPCERTPDTTIVQALHLMNSQKLYDKVTSDAGLAATLASSDQASDKVIEELYLSVYSRFPTAEESSAAVALLNEDSASRRKVVEGLLWAMLNTPEFVFKH